MKKLVIASLVAAFGLQTAFAHRVWLLPSSTVLSGKESWVTFDLSVSNNIFFFNHRALPVEGVTATAPDGSNVEVQNAAKGELRSTFDIQLKQEGTYRVGLVRSGYSAFWMEGEERKMVRGVTRDEIAAQGIAKKEGVRITDGASAILTYLTLGKPSDEQLKPTGKGLEAIFVDSHPNDLFAKEETKLRFLLNGEPAADLEVLLVKDGDRFRNDPGETTLKTDDKGECTIAWEDAGRYWIEAEVQSDGEPIDGVAVAKRASLSLTLEVLPE